LLPRFRPRISSDRNSYIIADYEMQRYVEDSQGYLLRFKNIKEAEKWIKENSPQTIASKTKKINLGEL